MQNPGNIRNLTASFVLSMSWGRAVATCKSVGTLELLRFHLFFQCFTSRGFRSTSWQIRGQIALQDTSKTSRRAPKTPRRAPKTSPRDLQVPPRRPPRQPRRLQEVSRHPAGFPKNPISHHSTECGYSFCLINGWPRPPPGARSAFRATAA